MTGFCLRGGRGVLGVVVVMRAAIRAGAVAVAGLSLLACRASVPGAGKGTIAGPGAAPSGMTVMRAADSSPITALAVAAPYVWAGTAHGLRRWKVAGKGAASDISDAAAEAIGREVGFLGQRIEALGVDDEGAVWVASEAGVGRFAEAGGRLRFDVSPAPAPAEVGALALLSPTHADGGAWAGGERGLARFDGHAWSTFEFLRDVAVTSLELDADGQAAWVGTRGRGLFRFAASADKQVSATPILAPGPAGGEEIVGTSPTKAGARVVAARTAGGGRITLITKGGVETYETQADAGVRFARLVASDTGPVLLASLGGADGAFELRPLPRGEAPAAGGFRLVDTRKGSVARYQALPLALAIPPEVTVAAVARGDGPSELWCGSRAMGVAQAAATRPRYLGGDLTDDADRLTVACAARDRCFVIAGGAHAWLFDGARFHETRVGEAPEGRALAVTSDAAGAIFGVITDPPFEGVAITRLAAGSADKWEVVMRVPLGRRAVRPSVSFATFMAGGNLWLGLGAVASDGQEQGRGALELTVSTASTPPPPTTPTPTAIPPTPAKAKAPPGKAPPGKAPHGQAPPPPPAATPGIVRHGNFPGAEASPESLPLPYDLTGMLFDGTATWFSARSGINRWQESELRHWGENEHMDSEVCLDVAKGSDGKIWVATSAGVGRFDGIEWRFVRDADGEAPATRALGSDGGGRMWLATAKGLRVLDASEMADARLPAGTRIVDDDMLDLTLDRFGRVWALGGAALAIVDATRTTTGGTR